jgi:hypothetical protein
MLLSPPPKKKKFGNDCKQASLFYLTNKYFHVQKNNTGYHIAQCIGTACLHVCPHACVCARASCTFLKLRSTTEHMPALVSY